MKKISVKKLSRKQELIQVLENQKSIAELIQPKGVAFLAISLEDLEDDFSVVIFGKYIGSRMSERDAFFVRVKESIEYFFQCFYEDLISLFKNEDDEVIEKLRFKLYDITIKEPSCLYKTG